MIPAVSVGGIRSTIKSLPFPHKYMLSCLLQIAAAAPTANGPTLVTKLDVAKVAFANLIDDSLYLSTFNPNPFGGKDIEYKVERAADLVEKKNVQVTPLTGSVTWPNLVQKAPASVFGVEGVVVSGGFLVPGRTNGGLWFSSAKDNKLIELFRGKDYFYHQVAFYDVNQDGKTDILTCRANKSMIGSGKGDLVWLEPVDPKNPLGKWQEHIVGKGCDTFFVLEDVNGDGKVDLVAAEFWGQKLTLIESANGRFDDASKFVYTTLDDKKGAMFGVELVDLNGDGKKDLLVTNHDGSGNGGVFAYELTDKWTRHDLAVGFPVLQSGPGQAAPGAAQAFFPTKGQTGKPNILVSGDGSQQAYILTPNTNTVGDWTYTQTVLHNCESTSGGLAIGDANHDGKTEIYVPCYDKGYLAVYSY